MDMISKTLKNEQGFVLIVSLLMLVVLMIIGIAATNTTTIELQISGNDKAAKQTFYQAEAGTQVGISLLGTETERQDKDNYTEGAVTVKNKEFYLNDYTTPTPTPDWSAPDATMGQTSLVYRSKSKTAPGGAMHMISAYEGEGKNSGTIREQTIWSRHFGNANSEATIVVRYNTKN